MTYSLSEVQQYIAEEDVKFIRLAFTDIFGVKKNVSIMPCELERAIEYGTVIDASAIRGFGGEVRSDLLLRPDLSTIAVLPWRPERGRVIRMFCEICRPDGTPFESDTRTLLRNAVAEAESKGVSFTFGSEMEFYLFRRDENGAPTKIPYDTAGYMDVSPADRGENIRREICLSLERMGIRPESSHHEEGPGQNEIDFRYSDPLAAADSALTFRFVVNTIASMNGLCADFSPKPVPGAPGNGMHINVSVRQHGQNDVMQSAMAGILEHIRDMTLFFNRGADSYERFGNGKAPKYVTWGYENRTQLIRIPSSPAKNKRFELRSPDSLCNPYVAFALVIWAGLDGIERRLAASEPADFNLYSAPVEAVQKYRRLPENIEEAREVAANSAFLAERLPESIRRGYMGALDEEAVGFSGQ